MKATIGDPPLKTVAEFHERIAQALRFPAYYGKNLDALWEVLCEDIERPTTLTWLNSKASRAAMPEWSAIIRLIDEVAAQDRERGVAEFELLLR